MNRLVDEIAPGGSGLARAADLVRRGGIAPDEERLVRVEQRLEAARAARVGAPADRLVTPLRIAGVVALVLAGYAALRLGATRQEAAPSPATEREAPASERPAAPPPAPLIEPSIAPPTRAPAPALPSNLPAGAPSTGASPAQRGGASSPVIHDDKNDAAPTRSPSLASAPAHAPSSRSSRKAPPPDTSDLEGEAALVRKATVALRHDNDPARAVALLREYRQRHPNGALLDEALYLSAEAGLATGDAQTARFARDYLARFPKGRFRKRMERVLTLVGRARE